MHFPLVISVILLHRVMALQLFLKPMPKIAYNGMFTEQIFNG